MFKNIKKYIEPNKKLRVIETIVAILLIIEAANAYFIGNVALNREVGKMDYVGEVTLFRQSDDYDEDSSVCEVVYSDGETKLIVEYPYEEYVELDEDSITAYKYSFEGTDLCFVDKNPAKDVIQNTYKQAMAEELMPLYNMANAFIILVLSLLIVLFFSKFFTTYEKCWFMSIMVLATIFAILFPEESANGVNGIVIMLLYLLDTFLNILCELLISKQSRYNFLVSVLVEITEIVICLVLRYRFATMAVTLFFWLPIDIISFINWSHHKDDEEDELTVVRRLKGYQEVLVIVTIVVWTIVVGYLLSGLDINTDFFGNNERLEMIITYIDACASAVGIANGLFIFFRLKEQWIAWYICALLEAIINVMTGQYVLLILKLGYFTNTTYGYIKWSRYINSHKEDDKSLF